jgi:hypothetical protein
MKDNTAQLQLELETDYLCERIESLARKCRALDFETLLGELGELHGWACVVEKTTLAEYQEGEETTVPDKIDWTTDIIK